MPLKCTNRSRPESSGVMNPNPLSSLNHLTVPVAIWHSSRNYVHCETRRALKSNNCENAGHRMIAERMLDRDHHNACRRQVVRICSNHRQVLASLVGVARGIYSAAPWVSTKP